MLYAEDIAKVVAENAEPEEDDDIEVVEEVSEESDIEESPDKSKLGSGMNSRAAAASKKEKITIEEDD